MELFAEYRGLLAEAAQALQDAIVGEAVDEALMEKLRERAERAEAERDAAADLLERLLTDRPEHGNGLNYSAVMDARAFLGRVETQNETTQGRTT